MSLFRAGVGNLLVFPAAIANIAKLRASVSPISVFSLSSSSSFVMEKRQVQLVARQQFSSFFMVELIAIC